MDVSRWQRAIGAPLFLVLLLAVGAAAANDRETLMTHGTAVIDIASDGRVAAVDLVGVEGEDAVPLFHQQVMGWRFHPVLLDGEASAVRVRARFILYLVREAGRPPALYIESLRFGAISGDSDEGATSDIRLVSRPTPTFPRDRLVAGAEAYLVVAVEIAADGSVRRTGVDQAYLRRMVADERADVWLAPFVRSAERALKGTRFNPSDRTTRHVLMPFDFLNPRTERAPWRRVTPVPELHDEWVREMLQSRRARAEREPRFEGDSERVVLLNHVRAPWL